MRKDRRRGWAAGPTIRLTVLAAFLSSIASWGFAATLPPGGSFIDDDGNVHEGNIEAIAAAGITTGCNPPLNDMYCPASEVTRGEMAAFLARSLELPDVPADYFTDDDGSLFETDINKISAVGITKGCNPPANTLYCPNKTVTREQMAAFLTRAFGYTSGSDANLFQDDDGSLFEFDIDRLGTAGITMGCNPPDNDLFCPADTVKRDQMASFLSRVLELPVVVPPPRPTTTTVPACDPSYPTVCIPPPPPDLDCGEIPYSDFVVLSPDPHDFDRDSDGVGCETTNWP